MYVVAYYEELKITVSFDYFMKSVRKLAQKLEKFKFGL